MTAPEIAERVRELSIALSAAAGELATLTGPLHYAVQAPDTFDPDWRVHPGEALGEILRERGITQQALADAAGLTQPTVSLIIQGKRNVSPFVAVRLERALPGVTAEFWCRYQMIHDLHAEREALAAASGQKDPLA